MNEAKHTPAPWYKRDVRESACAVDWEICYGQDDECVAEGVYTETDANLIAAAPELLEALEEVELYILKWPIGTSDTPQEQDDGARCVMLHKIQAAIAKAKGE